MKVLAFAASQREGSYNRLLIAQAAEIARAAKAEVALTEYTQFAAPLFHDAPITRADFPQGVERLTQALERADALMIAAPEYNWSAPGHLKNLIDWLSCIRPYPLAKKPALLLSASPARRGGLQGLIHLQTILSSVETRVHPHFFALATAHQAFNGEGRLNDALLQQELQEIIAGFLAAAKG